MHRPFLCRPAAFIACLLLSILFASTAFAASTQHGVPISMDHMLTDFESYADRAMKDWKTPGMAVAVVKGDRTIYAKGFGVRTAGTLSINKEIIPS